MQPKTFKVDETTTPNLLNLVTLNDVCDLRHDVFDDIPLDLLIDGIRLEVYRLRDTKISQIKTPYLSKLWDLFYGNQFHEVVEYSEDSDEIIDLEHLVDAALQELAIYYV